MSVRLRIRHPKGTLQIEAGDDWTPAQLAERIKSDTELAHFSLKTGFPPQDLDISDSTTTLADLKLNGSVVQVTPKDPPPPSPEDAARAKALSEQEARDAFLAAEINAADWNTGLPVDSTGRPADSKPDRLSVGWPEMDGIMVLRVMADDNSCLFTALAGALAPEVDDPAPHLRDKIARYILDHPETYNTATLDGKEPTTYVRNLRGKDFWGGSIEMSVLSDLYDIQIVAVDVKTGQAFPHGENKKEQCLVLYSGIHYDRLVLSPGEEYTPEMDVVRFGVEEESAVERAKQLAQLLKKTGYFTDTNTMVLRCNVPECDWLGDMKDAQTHIAKTGHQAFEEIKDTGAP